jgi:hypothetical protein
MADPNTTRKQAQLLNLNFGIGELLRQHVELLHKEQVKL